MDSPSPAEYSIDELAQASATSIRNIRAYQDRGLLPPPARRGRKGVYGAIHRSRLDLIKRMLERGYTLANIRELLQHWERGATLADLLGMPEQPGNPWQREQPICISMAELTHKFQHDLSAEALRKAIELDLIRPQGTRFHVPSMHLLNAVAGLFRLGIPLQDMLAVIVVLRHDLEQTSAALIALVDQHISTNHAGTNAAANPDAPQLAEVLRQLQPLVKMLVVPEIAHAMQGAASTHFGERLTPTLAYEPPSPGT